MPTLGDSFPNKEKVRFAIERLRPGRVLYLWCDFITSPKDKYLLLLSVGPPPLFFFINKGIHELVLRRPRLLECQLPIKVSDNQFLPHDSIVHCARVVSCVSQGEIAHQIMRDLSRVRGMLCEGDRRKVVEFAEKAMTISTFHKRLIKEGLLSVSDSQESE